MATFYGDMSSVYFLRPDQSAYLSEHTIEWDSFVPDEVYDYRYEGNFTYEYDSQGKLTDYAGVVQSVYGYHSSTGAVLEDFYIDSIAIDFSEFKSANFDEAVLLPKMFSGNDVLRGYGLLEGYAGNDVIYSYVNDNPYAVGNELAGGTGNDIYYVSPNDHIVERAGEGYDRVVSSVTFSLKGADLEALVLAGGDAAGAVGNDLNNKLVGNDAGNKMQGEGGNDALYGGLGRDALYGGLGNDTFVFDAAPGPSNLDAIYDFANVSSNNDTIRLDNAVFTALGGTGRLSEAAFAQIDTSSAVVSADAHILYNQANGVLSYDPDGGGSSGRVAFAVLPNHAALTHLDFLVV